MSGSVEIDNGSTTTVVVSPSFSTDVVEVGLSTNTVTTVDIGAIIAASPEDDTLDDVTGRGNTTTNDITVGGITADSLQLTGGSGTQGTLSWNVDEETLDLIQNGATLQVGQEIHFHAKNQTGSDIPNGTPVMAVGTLGASGRILIAPMVADGSVAPRFFLGLTTESIANGDDGKVTHFGKVRDLDTSGYTEGTVLWCDPVNPGGFTMTEPAAPNLKIGAVFVVNVHANNGTVMVRSDKGHRLFDSHDVQVSNQADKDALMWNSSTGRWENQLVASAPLTEYTLSDGSNSGAQTIQSALELEQTKVVLGGNY
jgi:hypothetical protein